VSVSTPCKGSTPRRQARRAQGPLTPRLPRTQPSGLTDSAPTDSRTEVVRRARPRIAWGSHCTAASGARLCDRPHDRHRGVAAHLDFRPAAALVRRHK
jgi:hypothetical protein